ncbi:MAG: 50S ribosomal protein L22 [Bdellovibrionota bacterium]|jgi:large subunit ribosomal protein L22
MARQRVNDQEIVARAVARKARVSTQKVRLILDLVRGKLVSDAFNILKGNPRKGAEIVVKLLESAVANAKESSSLVDIDNLWIAEAKADMGKTMRRWLPRAHGRATPLKKRTSHITVSLSER